MGCDTVTFVNHDTRHNLPNPKFIGIHAAIGHVLELSGAGKVLDEILDDFFDEGYSVPADMGDLMLRMSVMDFVPLNCRL